MTVNPRDIHVTTVESSNLTEKDNSVNEHDAFFFKVRREEVESHLQDFMKIHLDLACAKLSDTEDELKKTQDKLNDTQETTKTLTMKLETLQGRFETNMMMTKNESSIFPKRFVWKVSDFSNILSQAKASERKRIESDPFYTENYGYKLKLRIYPNGAGAAKNNNLSAFFVVMKGEYDAILNWPFKKRVRFTLIDQQDELPKRRNITKVIKKSDAKSDLERPTVENEGRGRRNFISHKTLYSRRYLVEDTLFIQFEIGPAQKVTFPSYTESDESD